MNDAIALKKSELRLKQAQQVAHVGSWELDFSTAKAIWSDEALNIYGLPLTDNIQSYDVWIFFVHPDDLEVVRKEIERAKASQSDSVMEHRIVLRDGTVKHIYSVTKFEFNDLGKPCGLFGVCCDITEKVVAREQLDFDQKNLDSLINNTGDLMWSVDRDYNLITSNKSFNEMAEVTFGRVIEKGTSILTASFNSEMFNHFKILYDRAFSGEAFRMTDYFETPSEIWTEISYSPIRKGDKVIGVACHARDVTDMKLAERRLIESELRYRSLVEQASDAISVFQDGIITEVNTSWKKMFGYSKSELPKLTAFDFTPYEDKDTDPQEPQAKVDENTVYEKRVRRKDGTVIEVEISSRLTEEGKIINIIRDITERKKNEVKLKEKCHDLNTYIYKTSHDLRGPVVSALGLINLIKSEFTDQKFLDYLEKLEQCSCKMLTTLDSLKEINKISDKQVIKQEIDFESTINGIISSLQNLPESGDIEFKIRVNLIQKFNSDRDLINSILQNLIHNSILYKRKQRGAFIQVLVYEKSNCLVIEVNDNGVGIPKNLQPKIFDMFYRANIDSKGSGLGLYIVKNVVEKLDGTISFVSEINKGCAFKIVLPILKK